MSENKCQFDKGERGCFSLACYSNQKCGARDEKGYPAYATIEEIKNEKDIEWSKK